MGNRTQIVQLLADISNDVRFHHLIQQNKEVWVVDETLKQYMMLFKEMNNAINGPDYQGKEKDIQHQKEQIEAYEKQLQQGFSTDYDYDVFADSVIKCAYGDMTLEDLEAIYYGLTTPFF